MPNEAFKLTLQWHAFLSEIDELLTADTEVICIGGFVMTEVHGSSRATGDLDHIESRGQTIEELHKIAGEGSRLHKKHRLYVQYVGVVTMPYEYESRLIRLELPFKRLGIYIPEVYDLVLSKLDRNSPKDQADVEFLARKYQLSFKTLRDRFDVELDYMPRREYHLTTLENFWKDWFQA